MSTGGGIENVGTVKPTMQMMSWDDKTRPMSRADLWKFASNPDNLKPNERELLEKAAIAGPGGMVLGGLLGWQFQKKFNWKWLGKRAPGLIPMMPLGRVSFVMVGMSIPYMCVQQWLVNEVLALDEFESDLAFHVKRFIVMQRGQLMFTKTQTREVTPEEQQKLGAASVEQRRATALAASHGERGSMDVNAALTAQTLTPHAQTGYSGGR